MFFLLLVGLQSGFSADIQDSFGDGHVSIATYGLNAAQTQMRPKVALVLSGGGARGFAHIPILEAIEEAGIPIDMVLGTSMGSLVGGLYAAGYSPSDMRRLIQSHDMVELFATSMFLPLQPRLLPLSQNNYNLFVLGFDKGGVGANAGLVGDQRILQMLNDSLSRVAGITDFDRFIIPFRCIGADLLTGERIIFSSGSLVAAIRSSISIPGIFTPYPVEDNLVIDGGLVDNLPIDLAKDLGADIVIAVDVNAAGYKATAQDLESLTAVFGQLVVILTKNTVVNQTKNADLLITPELGRHGILDFMNVQSIIEAGELASVTYKEEFEGLAQQIAQDRPLEIKNPERLGRYFSLPDVFVTNISHRSLQISGVEEEPLFNLAPFEKYLGLPLDTTRKTWLNQQLNDLRSTSNYTTVTYDYTDVYFYKSDMVLGTLEIQTREITPKRASIAAGAYGSTAIMFDPSGSTSYEFRPDFALRYNRNKLFDSPTSLSFTVSSDDAINISTELLHEIILSWDVGVTIGYTTGGIHPMNLRHSGLSADLRDRMITTGLFLQFHPQPQFVLQFANNYDFIWFETPPTTEVFIPSFRLDSSYATIAPGLFPRKGGRVDISLQVEGFSPFGYRLEANVQQIFELGTRHALWLDLRVGSAHTAVLRQSSLLHYGGIAGMPSYLAMTLVDDMVLARIKHIYWISDRAVPFVLQTMVTMGSRGELMGNLLSSNPYATNVGLPFSALQSPEASASLALGFSIGTVDFIVGAALDTNLRTAIFLEVH